MFLRTTFLLALGALLLPTPPATAQGPAGGLGLVPLPREVKTTAGTYRLPLKISLYARSADERNVAALLSEQLTQLGHTVTMTATPQGAHIRLATVAGGPQEGYQLTVDAAGVRIAAASGAGLFYGGQTLLQLLPARPAATAAMPFVRISDEPAFGWRGAHLDVSRHFFSVAFIKKYLDFLAAYKLNTFHWHLTDDQGWRIEIKKYPKLTEISALRKQTLIGAQQQFKTPPISSTTPRPTAASTPRRRCAR